MKEFIVLPMFCHVVPLFWPLVVWLILRITNYTLVGNQKKHIKKFIQTRPKYCGLCSKVRSLNNLLVML